MNKLKTALLVGALASAANAFAADTITDGFTFSVASNGNAPDTGTHYHSNTGGSFGNPAGKAEVGNYSSEQVRGLSEWNLTGLESADSAFVNLAVYNDGGLFTGVNDYPFTGFIDVFAYVGNNLEDISDYQTATTAFIGTFSTAGLSVGDIISFDITSIYNDAIDDELSSLGVRLQISADTFTQGGAWTFENIRLTTEAEGDVHQPVPEPSTVIGGMAIAGLFGSRLLRRKKA